MADYNTLTFPQKVQGALPGAFREYNVNNPPTTADDRDNLNRGIGALELGIDFLKESANEAANQAGIPVSIALNTTVNASDFPELAQELQPFIPPGYILTTFTPQEIINVIDGVKDQFIRIENSLSSGSPTIAPGLPANPVVPPTVVIAPQPVPITVNQTPDPIPVTSPQTTTNPSVPQQQSSSSGILRTAATAVAVVGGVSLLNDVLNPKPQKQAEQQPNQNQGQNSPDPASVGAQAGIPLIGDNGTVVQGFAINPETGQVYQTVDNTNQGLPGEVNTTRAQATLQDTTNFEQKADWRVRLSLSPGAYYLYKDESNELLAPLRGTDGIVFPYTPAVNVTYGANYQSNAPVHSNYKIFQYENSYVDTISITCDFTAQDTEEARYLLAVIHFLRSVTKMFYGQDFDPKPGTPPPLCYLFGLGEFQFNAHPLAITNFTYSLPNDVDYIRAGSLTEEAGQSRAQTADITKPTNTSIGSMLKNMATDRLGQGIASVGSALGLRLQPGGTSQGYSFGSSNRFNSPVPPGTVEPTYVPTKININISAIPIVSRYEISNNFSVKDYANGSLLQGVKRAGGGFW